MNTFSGRSQFVSRWPIFLVSAVLLFCLWVLLTSPSLSRAQSAVWLGVFVSLAATLAAMIYLRDLEGQDTFRSWQLIVITMWIWTMAVGIVALVWILTSSPLTSPSIVNLLELAGYLAAFTALIAYPIFQPERFGRLRAGLDMAILIISILALAWLVLIEPIIEANIMLPHRLFWLALAPVADSILLVLAFRLALLVREPVEQRALLFLVIGFLFLFISDVSSSYLQLQREGAGGGLGDASWMLGIICMGLALRTMSLGSLSAGEGSITEKVQQRSLRVEQLLPIIFTYIVVGFIVVDWRISGEINWVGIAWAAILILLLFARQGVIGGQQEMRQYAALINATSDMAFICDGQGRVQFSNPSLRSAVGENDDLRIEEFVRMDVDIEHVIAEAKHTGWSGEVSVLDAAESYFPALLSLQPLRDPRRAEILLAGTAHDLTAIRKREDELRIALDEIDTARHELAELNQELENKVQDRTIELEKTVSDLEKLNQELTTLDRLKSEFVALVSHELRAPLTNIRGGIEVVLSGTPDLPDSANESLKLVNAETVRLSRFVEMILDLSALEAGRFHLEIGPVHINEMIGVVLGRFGNHEVTKRIQIDIPKDIPAVMADSSALESICFHLIDNSLKYAPDGEIRISAALESEMIYVRVEDEGPGIPADEQESVFDMFHRLDATDAREVYGHGLGLPMVARLVQAMGGEVGIEEEYKHGVHIWFSLPTARSEAN